MLMDLMNKQSLQKETQPLELKMIELDQIIANEYNLYPINDIEQLADDIKLHGLQKPLEVFQDGDIYKLLGGERRLAAIQLLNCENQWDQPIQCLVYPAPSTTNSEKLTIIRSNAQREMSESDYLVIIDELENIFEQTQPGGRKVEWMSQYLDKSPRTIHKLLNKLHQKEQPKASEYDISKELKPIRFKIDKLRKKADEGYIHRYVDMKDDNGDYKQVDLLDLLDKIDQIFSQIIETNQEH